MDILTLAKQRLNPDSFNKFSTLHTGGAILATPSQDDQSYLCYLAILTDCDKDTIRQIALSSERIHVPHKDHKPGRHKWTYNRNYLSRSIRKACDYVANSKHTPTQDTISFKSWQDVKRVMQSKTRPPTEQQTHAAIDFIAYRFLPILWQDKLSQIGLDYAQCESRLNSKSQQSQHGQDLTARFSFEGYEKHGYTVQKLTSDQLTLGKYLPDIELTGFNTVFIQSDLGTGKTEFAKRVIDRFSKDKSVLVITPRQSLTINAAKRLGLNNYQDIKSMPTESKEQRKDKADAAKRMACTINSVQELAKDYEYDLVIIDESELLASHLVGSAFEHKKSGLKHFYDLLSKAKQVLFLDAFLSDLTLYIADKSNRPTKQSKIVVNPYHIWGGVNINWYEGNKKGLSLIIENIINDVLNGLPVFVFTNSKEKAESLKNGLIEKIADISLLLIDKNTVSNDQQKAFMASPDIESDNYNVIIATPTVETGLSIENPKFKTVYGIFENTDNTGTATGAMQQMARCRKALNWHIFSRDGQNENPIFENDILNAVKATLENTIKECSASNLLATSLVFEPNDVTRLYCKVKAWENTQKNNFTMSLYSILTDFMGCKVKGLTGVSEQGSELLNTGKEITTQQYITEFLKPENEIEKSEYDLFTSDRRSKLFAENRIACERYELQKFFNVNLTVDNEVLFNGVAIDCKADQLIKADNKGRGLRKQLMAVETATAPTSDVLQYAAANLIGNDFLNISGRDQTSYIHTLPTQHRVRKLALAAMGIDDLRQVDWSKPPTYTAKTIIYSEFAQYVDSNLTAVNAARVGVQFPTDWKANACYYFKAILTAMGFTSNRSQLSQPSEGGAAAGDNESQGKTDIDYRDNKGLPCDEKNAQKPKKPSKINNKAKKISIYTLGKTQFLEFAFSRQDSGRNWISEKLSGLKQWQAAGDQVDCIEAVISKLQSFIDVELSEKCSFTGNALTIDDYFNALVTRAAGDQDFDLMYQDVVATLLKIENDTHGRVLAGTSHFKAACENYLAVIKPKPLLPEIDLKLIKRLQKSAKGLQLGTAVARIGNGFNSEIIETVLDAVKALAKIGAVKFELNKQDKLKSTIKLIDLVPIYGHFCGVVI